MPNKLIAMFILRKLLLLTQRGLSVRAIAEELKISCTTVMEYRKRMDASGRRPTELLILEDPVLSETLRPLKANSGGDLRLEAFNALLDGYLNELATKRATRVILYEEYLKLYPDGFSYSKFCQLLSASRNIKDATLHNSYIPGDKMMFDFAGDKLGYVDRATGEIIAVYVFIAVLPYSSYCYVEGLDITTIGYLVSTLSRCVAYFGGTPASGKTDNMTQVVAKASRYQPTFTEALDQWAMHNGIALLAARRKKPRDKAPAEAHVRIVYQQIYTRIRNDVFYSLKELNEALIKYTEQLNDRPMQGKDYSRRQRFLDLEKPALKPLVEPPFVLKHRAERKISLNYHFKVQEDGHQYSVPFSYIGKTLTGIYDSDTLEIYDGMERILIYPRMHRPGYTTKAEHMPSNHKAYLDDKSKTAKDFLYGARKIGPFTEQYIECLLNNSKYEEQAYDSCLGILRMASKVTIGSERLEFACKRGLRVGRYGYSIISKILDNNQDKAEKELMDPALQDLPILHENLRGPEAYK